MYVYIDILIYICVCMNGLKASAAVVGQWSVSRPVPPTGHHFNVVLFL